MSRDILAVIDGALEDWETSDDAMRWTPERPEEAAEPWLSGEAWAGVIVDEIHAWNRAFDEMQRQLIQSFADIQSYTATFIESATRISTLTDEARAELAGVEPDLSAFALVSWPSGDLPACLIKGSPA